MAYWDGTTILPSSWYLTQTPQWKQFRYQYWQLIEMKMCCYGYKVQCLYCGWSGKKTKERHFCLDHIIPYTTAPHLAFNNKNIAICCNHCNKEKGNKFLDTSLSEIVLEHQLSVANFNNSICYEL